MAKVLGVLMVLVSTACAGPQRPELIAQREEAVSPSLPPAELNTPVLAATTTTVPPTTVPSTTALTTTTEYLREQATTGACGGSLPPCYVMIRESRGSLTVYNYSGSGASGKWQFMPGTWNGYGGYANAADAPESVQDAKARELWDGGRGCSHWDAC